MTITTTLQVVKIKSVTINNSCKYSGPYTHSCGQSSQSKYIVWLDSWVRIVVDSLFWQNPLITPVVTPRFVLSCTSHLLKKLGHIAKKYDVPIQVHFLKQNVIRIKRGFMLLDLSRTANCLLKSKIMSMANITFSLALK